MKPLRFATLVVFPLFLCSLYINSTTFFRMKLAEHYVKTQNINRAIIIYNKILRKEELTPRYNTLSADNISSTYFTLASLYLKKNRFIESAKVLKKISVMNPAYKIDFTPSFKDNENYRKFGLTLAKIGLYAMSIKQFKQYLKTKQDNPIVYYLLGLIYLKESRQDDAIEQFKSAIQLSDNVKDHAKNSIPDYLVNAYCNLGIIYQEKGDIEKAKDYYESAISLQKNRAVIALNNLKDIYEREDNVSETDILQDDLENLTPFYVVNHKFENSTLFLGYSMDEKEFELFSKGKTVFIWQINGKRIYDIRDVENLAPNFGFETDVLGEGFSNGWDTDIYANSKTYKTPIDSHVVVSVQKGFDNTQCLLLDNSLSRCTNCQTDYIVVDSNDSYLQAGWVYSVKGDGRIGGQWFDSKRHPILYNFIAKYLKLNRWKHYAQVVTPPKESKYYRLWVNNYENQGKIYFDDIVFVKLEFPKSV